MFAKCAVKTEGRLRRAGCACSNYPRCRCFSSQMVVVMELMVIVTVCICFLPWSCR